MRVRMHKGLFVAILLGAIAVLALGSTFFYWKSRETQAADLTVVTSFYPMYIAAENVTEGRMGLRLESLSEPQTGCLHDYQLTPEDMELLATADVFVVNGGGIEEFLTDIAAQYPELTIVDASEGLELEEDNGHVWMSVPLHRQQVQNIAEGLAAADPGYRELYEENAAAYDEKLALLQQEQEELAPALSGKPVVLFHEAYEYVAHDYGMQVVYVMDLNEERQVSAGEVAEMLTAVRDGQVTAVLAEELYGSEMGAVVEQETDAGVYYLDTLVRGDYDRDSYLERMEQNIAILREIAAGQSLERQESGA